MVRRSVFSTSSSEAATECSGGYSAVTMLNSSRNRDTRGMVEERIVVMWITESFLDWMVFGMVSHL